MKYSIYYDDNNEIFRIDNPPLKGLEDKYNYKELNDIPEEVQNNLALYYYDGEKFIKNQQALKEQKKNILRGQRQKELEAFDIYKSNYLIGVLDISESKHRLILRWYQKILDLDEEAIKNPPKEITKYMK